ncbi:MAG TPA: RHS repeat-associated core domain-containing protein, partial [Acidimicrobiales bacterium]|nr:RHS repeat-associated core domain-containing protein [Acidimicrobiales bacterium]
TLYFYWGTSGSLAEETDGAGATKVAYLVDDDFEALGQEVVTRPLTGGEVRTWTWLLPDATGNVATHLDDAGAVVEQSAYDPYGKDDKGGSAKKAGTTAPNSTLGFQSAMTDKVTGAVVLGPRQYDPTTSRFTTPDVFVASALDVALGADELTGNRYLFAGANPVAFYEDGHWGIKIKLKLPSPLKAVKKLATKALPFVPVVGTGIEAISIATGRDWLEGGRKMTGQERLLRTGMLAAGAVVGVGATKVAAKVVEKTATKAKTIAKVADDLGPRAGRGVRSLGGVDGKPITVYANRVWKRAEQEPRFHRFPMSFDGEILEKGAIDKVDGVYVQRSLPGTRVSKRGRTVGGRYEIGYNLTRKGNRLVTHRFFNPKRW